MFEMWSLRSGRTKDNRAVRPAPAIVEQLDTRVLLSGGGSSMMPCPPSSPGGNLNTMTTKLAGLSNQAREAYRKVSNELADANSLLADARAGVKVTHAQFLQEQRQLYNAVTQSRNTMRKVLAQASAARQKLENLLLEGDGNVNSVVNAVAKYNLTANDLDSLTAQFNAKVQSSYGALSSLSNGGR
jgi:hypothetical protein